MQQAAWLEQYLEKVGQSSEEGRIAVEYVRTHKTRVGFKRCRKSVGAFWTITRKLYLNSRHYTQESTLDNPRALTLFVHEVRHLQSAPVTAISIYGELDAWQYEFRLYKKITAQELSPLLEELLVLPLNFDRANLRHVQDLMTKFAGKGYAAWILPLYPLTQEIKY